MINVLTEMVVATSNFSAVLLVVALFRARAVEMTHVVPTFTLVKLSEGNSAAVRQGIRATHMVDAEMQATWLVLEISSVALKEKPAVGT